jgi:hypothetical protein
MVIDLTDRAAPSLVIDLRDETRDASR